MGCADCYEAFRPLLCPLLAEIQRGTSHVGKHPGATARIPAPAVPPAPAPPPAPPASDLRTLEKSLVRAVTAEDYEKAAALRDEIRRLRAGNPPASGPQDSGSSQVPAAGRETP
jgi:protein arginine kinase activator